MGLNFATAWEAIADAIPDSDALIQGDVSRSWAIYDDRAARLASALAEANLAPGANIGLCLFNGVEYSEAQFAAFKQRVTPFNVNYRYTAAELHSLLEGADAQAPLARAVIGGLLGSTAITLLLIPAIYSVAHAVRPGAHS